MTSLSPNSTQSLSEQEVALFRNMGFKTEAGTIYPSCPGMCQNFSKDFEDVMTAWELNSKRMKADLGLSKKEGERFIHGMRCIRSCEQESVIPGYINKHQYDNDHLFLHHDTLMALRATTQPRSELDILLEKTDDLLYSHIVPAELSETAQRSSSVQDDQSLDNKQLAYILGMQSRSIRDLAEVLSTGWAPNKAQQSDLMEILDSKGPDMQEILSKEVSNQDMCTAIATQTRLFRQVLDVLSGEFR